MLLYILLQSQNVYAVSFIGEEENKKKKFTLGRGLGAGVLLKHASYRSQCAQWLGVCPVS